MPPRISFRTTRGDDILWLVLSVGLLASVPVVVSVARAVVDGWTPVLDDGILATNAFDVFTRHSALLGVYSDSSLPSIGVVHDLGPLLFWLMAVPARFLGAWALPVTIGVVNVSAVIGAVVLAHRRGGLALMFATTVAVIVMTHSLPAETWHDPLNPSEALLPLLALFFLAWSVGCGEIALLPITALAASFVLQSHYSLAIPAIGSAVLAVAGLVVARRRRVLDRANSRPWIITTLVVVFICWLPPVIDQLIHRPGNLVRLLRTATASQPTLGVTPGWHALVRALGIWPWWLRSSENEAHRLYDVVLRPPLLGEATTALMLLGLAAIVALGWRRGRQDVVTGGVLGGLIALAIVVGVQSTPLRLSLATEKAVRWTAPAGVFVWLLVGWGIGTLWLSPRLRSAVGRWPLVVGLAASVAAATVIPLVQKPDTLAWTYRPARRLVAQVEAHLPRGKQVLVDGLSHSSDLTSFAFQTALVYQLRRDGYQVRVPPGLALLDKLGPAYRLATGRPYVHLLVEDSATANSGDPTVAHVSLSSAPHTVEPHTAVAKRAIVVSIVPVHT